MEDLKKLKIKNWKETAKGRRTGKDLVEKEKTDKGLQCQMVMVIIIIIIIIIINLVEEMLHAMDITVVIYCILASLELGVQICSERWISAETCSINKILLLCSGDYEFMGFKNQQLDENVRNK